MTNYKNLGKLKYFYNGGLKTQSYWAMVHSLCKLIVIALAMLLQMLFLHLPFLTLTLILIPILMLIVGCNCHWSKTPITGHLKSIAALQIGRHAMQIEMPSQQ